MIGVVVQALTSPPARPGARQTLQRSLLPAQTHPPIWPELAAGAEPRSRLCKEWSLRKRIAKRAKRLARPTRA